MVLIIYIHNICDEPAYWYRFNYLKKIFLRLTLPPILLYFFCVHHLKETVNVQVKYADFIVLLGRLVHWVFPPATDLHIIHCTVH